MNQTDLTFYLISAILIVCMWIIWTTKECDKRCLRGEFR